MLGREEHPMLALLRHSILAAVMIGSLQGVGQRLRFKQSSQYLARQASATCQQDTGGRQADVTVFGTEGRCSMCKKP